LRERGAARKEGTASRKLKTPKTKIEIRDGELKMERGMRVDALKKSTLIFYYLT
jgi:hypothetical protein